MFSKVSCILILILIFFKASFAQKKDTTKSRLNLKSMATILISSNGISPFPNIVYGKPATNITISIGKKGLFFEPDLRWGINGKPWIYIYWIRYKFKKSEKFGINTGIHTAYNIKPCVCTIDGKEESRYLARRNIAGEIVPTFYFSEKFNLSIQYLRTKGLDKTYGTQMSRFLSLQPKFPKIKLTKNLFLSYNPQFYHLIIDKTSGFYFSQSILMNRKNFPLSLSTVLAKSIKTSIPGDKFVWNAGIQIKL